MNKQNLFRLYFLFIGIYDVVLGLGFVLFYKSIYQFVGATLPNHPGYIYVPALFLASGGIGEFMIAKNPLKNIDLVAVRLLMKVSFAAVVFYYYFKHWMPTIYVVIALMSILGIILNLYFLFWARSAK